VLRLVVGGTAAVETIALLDDVPGSQTFMPLVFVAAYDVSVTVAEHRRQLRFLDSLREQHRPVSLERIIEDPPIVAHVLECGSDLVLEITVQIRQAFRILTLGWNRYPSAQLFHVVAVVVVSEGAIDDFFAGSVFAHGQAAASAS
jgi:hypothetical protein